MRVHRKAGQNFVFECLINAAQFRDLKTSLLSLIDPDCDALRFYNLGNSYRDRIELLGSNPTEYYEDPIVL